MNRLKFIAIVICLLVVSGCGKKAMFNASERLPEKGWSMNEFATFNVEVTDTLGNYNLYLQLRNDSRYRWSNIWLFVQTFSPGGTSIRDTLECRLADDRGKWLGRGIGNSFSVEIPYKYQVRFPLAGTYRFEVFQGMRDTLLEHITEVGLRIEKSN